MILRKMVFILGAGASNPYGYPIGKELRRWICKDFPHRLHRFLTGRPIMNFDASPKEVKDAIDFAQIFEEARIRSIDRFLAINAEYSDIGKMAIAMRLIEDEEKSRFEDDLDDNWYFYLYNRMIDGLQTREAYKQFGDNEVTFITFNYDRSLEHYLFKSLRHSFGIVPDEDVTEQLNKISIHHVYGKVDELPWQGGKREYGSKYEYNDIRRVQSNIKLIFETTGAETDAIKAAINSAKAIYFLGFGYDESNMRAIGLPDVLKAGQVVFGTALKSTQKERENVLMFLSIPRAVNAHYIKIEDCKCVELLRRNL